MSRCLPYTRPNYKRDDVLLIGSIKKLQIQWGNTKQRNLVSRKVKEKQNKKRSREKYDKLDSLQHKNKKRKVEMNIKFNESCHYARKEDLDHLERSDLSEEHDPPALVLSQCNSSKGAQNSRKKNAINDSDSNKKKPGLVIRIKLPLKKHKDVDPESASTDNLCCSSKVTKSFKAQVVLTDSAPYCSSEINKTSKVEAVLTESAPYCSSEINKTSKVEAVLTESAPHGFSEVTKLSEVQAVSIQYSLGCSSQVTKPSKARTVLTEPASLGCYQIIKPSKSKSVSTDSALRRKEVLAAKQPETFAEPYFSGPVAKAPIFQEGFVEANPSELRYKRSSGGGCIQKSERQLFRDLIINWKPPPIQPIEADEGEPHWLFAPKKSQDAQPSAQICKSDISNRSTCPTYASSLQPRATYIPEFGMYQLPYVIPF